MDAIVLRICATRIESALDTIRLSIPVVANASCGFCEELLLVAKKLPQESLVNRLLAKDYEAYTAVWKSKKWPDVPASKNGRT